MTVRHVDLVGPDGFELSIGLLSVSGGSVAGFTLESLDLSPAPRPVDTKPLPLVQGALVTAGRLTARQVRVSGMVVAPTPVEVSLLRAALVRVLGDFGETPTLLRWLYDGTTVEVSGFLDGQVRFSSTRSAYLRFDFLLTCPDPVAYEVDEQSEVVSSSGAVVLQNVGSSRVWPRFVLTLGAGVTGVTVANADSGESMVLSDLDGSVLEIETRPGFESVLLDGVSAVGSLSDASQFVSLRPGGNTVSVSVSAGSGSVSGDVVWRSGWVE